MRAGRVAQVLVVLAGLAVALAVVDAAWAGLTRAYNSAPQFLFMWVLPQAIRGGGRFITLAATWALPVLAVALPALALCAARRARRRRLAAAAAVLLGLGLASDGALYLCLGAAGQGAGPAVTTRSAPLTRPGATVPAVPVVGRADEKIVFASDRQDGWQLWLMNPDGSHEERLSRTARTHMQPRFSPDGREIVFTSGTDERHAIHLLDLATREEREVCSGDQASFTGDGKGLVFRRAGLIWHRDLAGGAERRISPEMWTRCAFPSASPDGAWVAFAARLMAGYDLFLVPLAGGGPRRLVSGRGYCDPRWSPSGRLLSYQTETHLFTVSPDGSEAFQATIGGGVQHYAAWSPDETRLAYCQGPSAEGPWQIYVVSLVKDEEPVQLTTEGSNVYPDWGKLAPAPVPRE